MRVYKSTVVAFVAFTVAALPAGAQDAETVEVTPYMALGSAGFLPSASPSRFRSHRRSVSRRMWHIVVARATSTR